MYKPENFLYSSGYLHSVMGKEADANITEKLISSPDFASARKIALDYLKCDQSSDVYREIDNMLADAYKLCYDISDSAKPIDIFSVKYLCHNVKTAIKLYVSDTDFDLSDYLFFDIGIAGKDELKQGFISNDFSFLPDNVASSVMHSVELYKKTGDPQLIDLTVDKAGLSDMKAIAIDLASAFIENVVSVKIDEFNILSFIRCVRMNKSNDFYVGLIADGGKLPTEIFSSCYSDGISALFEKLGNTEYSSLIKAVSTDENTAFYERLLESYFNSILDDIKYVPYGAELIVKYLLTKEKSAANMRIVLTAKNVGLPNTEIRAFLRN